MSKYIDAGNGFFRGQSLITKSGFKLEVACVILFSRLYG
jgi:hypothetical protein